MKRSERNKCFFSLSCNLSELLECFLLYRLLSAPGCQSNDRRRRDMSVNRREPGSCIPLVTDGGVDKALAPTHSHTHFDLQPPSPCVQTYSCMGNESRRVCTVCARLCGCVHASGLTLHLFHWDFTVNINVCARALQTITWRQRVIKEFPEFEFCGENETC